MRADGARSPAVIHIERSQEVVHHVRAGDIAAGQVNAAAVRAGIGGGAFPALKIPPPLVGRGKLERLAAHREVKIAGRVMNFVPNRLGFQALQPEVPEIGVPRVDLSVLRDLGTFRLRGQLIGVRRHDQPVKPLHAVIVSHELRSEIVQQLRIGGFASQQAEVAGDSLQAFPEVPTPDAIHGHARKQRILGSGQPLNERLAPAVAEIYLVRLERKAWLHGLVQFGTLRIAGGEYVALLFEERFVFFHRPVRRQRGDTPERALILRQRIVLGNLFRVHQRLELGWIDAQYRVVVVRYFLLGGGPVLFGFTDDRLHVRRELGHAFLVEFRPVGTDQRLEGMIDGRAFLLELLPFFTVGKDVRGRCHHHVVQHQRVEDGLHRIEIFLRDRVEFVIVALRAADRHSHEGRRHGFHGGESHIAIHVVSRDRGTGQEAESECVLHVAFDARPAAPGVGGHLRPIAIPQNLSPHKLVVGHVVVQRPDHPVPPEVNSIGGGHHRIIQAVQIRVPKHVQPMASPPNPVLLIPQEAIHRFAVRLRRFVGKESVLLGDRGRNAYQVKINAAEKCQFVGFSSGKQTLGFVVRGDEGVDGIRGSGDARRHRGPGYGLQRPQPRRPLGELLLHRFFRSTCLQIVRGL